MNVFSFNIFDVDHKNAEDSQFIHDHSLQRSNISEYSGRLVISNSIFVNQNETVLDLKIFTSDFNNTFLLVICGKSIFAKRLTSSQRTSGGADSTDPRSGILKILSVDELLQSSLGLTKFRILDVKMLGKRIYFKIGELSSRHQNGRQPCFYILQLLLDEPVKQAKSILSLADASKQQAFPEIFDLFYFPLFQKNIHDFWIDPGQPSQVFFSLGERLYTSRLILADSDHPSDANSAMCKCVYRNHFGIHQLQFSSEGDFAICSDKPDRVIVLNKFTWQKTLDFQLKLGEVRTMILNDYHESVFV